MNLSRYRLGSTILLALAASIYGCGGDGLTLPGDAQPTHIVLVTGDAQAGIAGTALPLPLTVKVTDDLGRGVVGQSVEFTVTGGGGGVTPASVETDAEGRASSTWTLGPSTGAQAVEAAVVGTGVPAGLTFDFSATAVAGSGSLIAAVSGDDQSAPVNSVLPESLVVRVSDGNGNPVSGISITWTVQGGGSISPETVVTDDDGRAAADRVLGAIAGQQMAQASGDALAGSPVTFVQTAVPSNPTTLTLVSGDAQGAPAGTELAADLVVKLTDADGNGVGGRAVAWVVTTGGGTVDPPSSTTDPSGTARARWTLGASAGANALTAVFSGLPPVPFMATASNDVPSNIVLVSGDNQSAVGGAALANPLVVKVTDANDNPVENVTVTWTAVGGGSVSSPTSATNAAGVAQITRTLDLPLATYTTTAEATGPGGTPLTGSPVTFTSTATVGQATKIVIVTAPSTAAVDGLPLAVQPVVQVQDAGGNGVAPPPAGRAVTASLFNPPSGATLNGDLSKDTDPNGQATFTDLDITGPIGTYTIRFRSGGLTEARADVAVTPGALSGSKSTITASGGPVKVGEDATITVTAKDVGGNPMQGVTVVLGETGGSGTPTFGQPAATGSGGITTGTFRSTGIGAHSITATLNGSTTTSTHATVNVTAGNPASIAAQAGASPQQSAPVNSNVPTAPAVIVKDAGDNPVPGIQVTFVASGDGSVTGGTPSTNSSGIATVGSWKLGSTAGTGNYTLTATISGSGITGNPVTFTASALAGGPDAGHSSLVVSSNTMTAGGTDVTVTVTVRDVNDNLLSGKSVIFTDNDSQFDSGTTGANGVATGTYSGTTAGGHTIGAMAGGVTISHTETVTVSAGAAATVSFTTGPSSTTTGATIAPPVVVHVVDAFENPAEGEVLLTLGQVSGTGVLSGTNPQPLSNGNATFDDLAVDQTGLYTLTATSGSVSSPDPQPSFSIGPSGP